MKYFAHNQMKLPLLFLIFYFVTLQSGLTSGKKTNKTRNPKIVGGAEIPIEKVPYQVGLAAVEHTQVFCGGAIISKMHILTAGHCVFQPNNYEVRVGSNVFGNGIRMKIAKVHLHPKYGETINDIAVLTLKKNLKFSRTVTKIQLPSKDEKYRVGDVAFVSGYGRTSEAGPMTTTLRGVHVPIIKQRVCMEYIEPYEPNTLCAGNLNKGGEDACQGDSGGPLVFNNKIIGIVSYGFGCARKFHPGVYTDVRRFLDFIMIETNNLNDSH